MNFMYLKKVSTVLCMSAFSVVLTACATGKVSTKAEQQRNVGYSNVVSINGRHEFGGGSVVKYEQLQNEVALLRKTLPVKSKYQFVAGNGLFTIGFAEGDFETNFGKQAELILNFQPCNSIANLDTPNMTCVDPNPTPAITVRRSIVLKGGESVHVVFPNGVDWTYRVFDKNNANISE